MELLNIDEDDVCAVLRGKSTVWDFNEDADDDWKVQQIQAELAKRLGYDGCERDDEQGRVVAMCMFGREYILK